MTIVTKNYGRGGLTRLGTLNYGLGGYLDATRHVEAQSHVGSDGYTIMDAYNSCFAETAVVRLSGAQG